MCAEQMNLLKPTKMTGLENSKQGLITQEIRASIMCEMKRFKEEATKHTFCHESVVDLLNRKHIQILADEVDACKMSKEE